MSFNHPALYQFDTPDRFQWQVCLISLLAGARKRRLAGLAPRAAGSIVVRRTASAAQAPTLRLLQRRHLYTATVSASADDRRGS